MLTTHDLARANRHIALARAHVQHQQVSLHKIESNGDATEAARVLLQQMKSLADAMVQYRALVVAQLRRRFEHARSVEPSSRPANLTEWFATMQTAPCVGVTALQVVPHPEPGSDADIWRLAGLHLERLGQGALVIAAEKVLEMERIGDADGRTIWKRIFAAMLEILTVSNGRLCGAH